jgi:hypothetical protein
LRRPGEASLRCAVVEGRASACAIITGNEKGFFFGSLALRAATRLPLPVGSDGAETQLDYQWIILDPGSPPSAVCPPPRDLGVGNRVPKL